MRSSKTEGKDKINDVMTEKNGSAVKEDSERNNQNKTVRRQKIVVMRWRRKGDKRQTKKQRV